MRKKILKCSDHNNPSISYEKSGSQNYSQAIADAKKLRAENERLKARIKVLQENEERLSILMEHNPSVIFIKDEEGKYVYLNKTYEKQFLTIKDWFGKTDFDMWPRESAELFRANDKQVLKDGRIHQFFEGSTDLQGKKYCWLCYKFPFTDSRGDRYVGGIGIEVTARILAEEALLQSEDRFRALSETCPIGIGVCSTDGTFLYTNPAYDKMLGYDRGELWGRQISDVCVNANDKVSWLNSMNEGVSVRDIEVMLRTKMGYPICVLVNTSYIRYEDTQAIIGAIQDITERKNLEAMLQESRNDLEKLVKKRTAELEYERQFLQTIFDNIPVMLAVHRGPHQVPRVNKEIEKILGWSQHEMDTIDIMAELYPDPDYRQKIREYMVNPGQSWKDIKMRSRDGNILDTRWMNISLPEDTRIGIGLDVTERNLLEEQLRQSHKMEAIGTLAGGIAHDFNNILAAVMGFTEMALDDVANPSSVENNLRHVMRSAIRAKELVKQILAFSRKTTHERIPLALAPIVQETVEFLRASIPATAHMTLSTNCSSGVVLAAPVEIQQIIMNLVTNALHAMDNERGLITITLSDIDFDPDPNFGEMREYIQIAVKDDGVGMTPSIMKRIFEPFFTTRKQGEGAGMGLAVIYGIIKDLGGTITVESQLGKGSIFRVFLPKSEQDIRHETQQFQIPHGSERILFVDDEPLLVEWGKKTLENLGYTVIGLADPNQAIEIYSNNPFSIDVVITDQTMPGMSGKDLCEEILRIREDAVTILCTGYNATISPEKAEKLGIRAFLMKPLTRLELALAIRKTLEKSMPVS